MRKSVLAAVIALSGLVSPAASAFDPDTPVGEKPEAFPITLGDEEDATIDLAFRTAFGLPKGAEPEAARTIDERSYHFRPVAIHLLENNTGVLLSVGSLDEAGHSEGGLNAIHYLKSSPDGWVKQGEWIGLGATGTVGNGATSWAFSSLLGRNPYLITAGGGVWQGCAIGSAAVTELAPDGPVDRGSFTDGMSSGAGLGQTEQEYEGKIAAAVPDKSFTVAYTGTRSFKQEYVLNNGKYELVGKDQVPGC
ncbi:hypothetical protein [Sphingopyxis macrogoltabida]|uniref:Uncharacterized protein n=1 Tax=Sphingopyxis macrogoltabida TaxID=33050 RepID=A0AAC9FFK3_SPHMC|nr:hypothetical protein [Sphingopyxis macrogoltabida]ALJ12802.1 hypothetical protein LH19_07960 [Sphingopyxis macrogoltabida]AMU89731.1 hypothetical protein ATM17_11880 [Sphingopyxis macrogoltabida]